MSSNEQQWWLGLDQRSLGSDRASLRSGHGFWRHTLTQSLRVPAGSGWKGGGGEAAGTPVRDRLPGRTRCASDDAARQGGGATRSARGGCGVVPVGRGHVAPCRSRAPARGGRGTRRARAVDRRAALSGRRASAGNPVTAPLDQLGAARGAAANDRSSRSHPDVSHVATASHALVPLSASRMTCEARIAKPPQTYTGCTLRRVTRSYSTPVSIRRSTTPK